MLTISLQYARRFVSCEKYSKIGSIFFDPIFFIYRSMNYLEIKTNDIANGDGVRVSLFVSGCSLRCKGCFNPESWDLKAGELFDDDALGKVLSELDKPHISGLSILGGDPFEPENIPEILWLVDVVRESHPGKTIWAWTGRKYEQLMRNPIAAKVISNIDVIVDGPFVESKKVLGKFYGSSNQRLIKIKDISNQTKALPSGGA